MSWKFYNSVVEEECKLYGIEKKSLNSAFIKIAKAYCDKALEAGNTFVDYNNPGNRCAYLHKYAALHTSLVKRYFLKFVRKKEVKKMLTSKKTLNICCLGGGPGTDFIGMLTALALFPQFHRKVVKVVILDICRGWCNSFKFIISSLLDGKVENIPADFLDTSQFIAEIIEVDLLEALPVNVVEAIAAADIVCSVKFISAILSNPASARALKTITDFIKSEAVFLFIDNLKANVFKLVESVCELSRLKIILGPIHENFTRCPSKESKEAFKYSPSSGTHVSVIGMIKLEKNECIHNGIILNSVPSFNSNEDSWSSEVESEISNDVSSQPGNFLEAEEFIVETSSKVDNCTQTNEDVDFDWVPSNFEDDSAMHLENAVESLESALNSLLLQFDEYFQKTYEKKGCACCNC